MEADSGTFSTFGTSPTDAHSPFGTMKLHAPTPFAILGIGDIRRFFLKQRTIVGKFQAGPISLPCRPTSNSRRSCSALPGTASHPDRECNARKDLPSFGCPQLSKEYLPTPCPRLKTDFEVSGLTLACQKTNMDSGLVGRGPQTFRF